MIFRGLKKMLEKDTPEGVSKIPKNSDAKIINLPRKNIDPKKVSGLAEKIEEFTIPKIDSSQDGFQEIVENHIFMKETFLTPEECDTLISFIKKDSVPSRTINNKGEDEISHFRTSQTCFMSFDEPSIKKIDNKICSQLGVDPAYSELIQGQFYSVGEEFKVHADFFDGSGAYKHTASQGNRTFTFMIYLNDVESGGGTYFPHWNIRIMPKKGKAVYWHNLDEYGNNNPQMRHAGEPILKGEKFIITKWFREKADPARISKQNNSVSQLNFETKLNLNKSQSVEFVPGEKQEQSLRKNKMKLGRLICQHEYENKLRHFHGFCDSRICEELLAFKQSLKPVRERSGFKSYLLETKVPPIGRLSLEVANFLGKNLNYLEKIELHTISPKCTTNLINNYLSESDIQKNFPHMGHSTLTARLYLNNTNSPLVFPKLDLHVMAQAGVLVYWNNSNIYGEKNEYTDFLQHPPTQRELNYIEFQFRQFSKYDQESYKFKNKDFSRKSEEIKVQLKIQNSSKDEKKLNFTGEVLADLGNATTHFQSLNDVPFFTHRGFKLFKDDKISKHLHKKDFAPMNIVQIIKDKIESWTSHEVILSSIPFYKFYDQKDSVPNFFHNYRKQILSCYIVKEAPEDGWKTILTGAEGEETHFMKKGDILLLEGCKYSLSRPQEVNDKYIEIIFHFIPII